jgi:hypothetical protein
LTDQAAVHNTRFFAPAVMRGQANALSRRIFVSPEFCQRQCNKQSEEPDGRQMIPAVAPAVITITLRGTNKTLTL